MLLLSESTTSYTRVVPGKVLTLIMLFWRCTLALGKGEEWEEDLNWLTIENIWILV